ncbi:H(+)/Cl(-) exchange transporter ClcA [Francisellaceae bacterium]|nr:H(+)/Cl(-) exchange transporter ClcA [Francisellaceae bacterium]
MSTFRRPSEVVKYSIWGALTGIGIGCIGALFQLVIHWVLLGKLKFFGWGEGHPILKLVICVVLSTLFIIIAILIMKRFAPETNGSGVPHVEGVLEGKVQMNWKRILPVKFFSGIFALSSGLVLGREGPTIQMGAAVGQMFGERFKLDKQLMMCLIAAGAGAGLGTAFNAPLAGILFVIEEMRHQFDYSFKSFQAVIIACVCADICLRVIFHSAGFDLRAIADIVMSSYESPAVGSYWLFIICGICFGVMGVLFNRYLVHYLNFFSRMPKKRYWRIVIAIGIVAGVCSIYFPDAVGGGYTEIPKALHNQIPILLLVALVVIRMFTTCVSYGTGIPGGIFAPLLAIGTTFGMLFGLVCNFLMPELIPSPQVFAVAGMAALFTAAVGAPLTGIVLVVEMTMNFQLILPLILTCFSATIAAICMGAMPIYSTLLERALVMKKKESLYLNGASTRKFWSTFHWRS